MTILAIISPRVCRTALLQCPLLFQSSMSSRHRSTPLPPTPETDNFIAASNRQGRGGGEHSLRLTSTLPPPNPRAVDLDAFPSRVTDIYWITSSFGHVTADGAPPSHLYDKLLAP
ncbi:unnamed protein product [Schistocephalus solidus]|uniref:Integrase catalytic domain-containing protein n=1 Tax=Schistocephalus solidus TaxID=70667 RepID=A0A183SEA6_SCHSO|nr:unnamed protein product [Schistocephalus solidus]